MLGGLGVCGRKLCCANFLSDFVQVSIKMAKEQNFSLNSSKVSGTCGRLMCCLRYEHETYEEAIKKTPSVGSYVSTPNGLGTVVEARPLAETIKVKLDEKSDAPKLYDVSDVRVLRSKGKSGLQPSDENEDVIAEETLQEAEPSPVKEPQKKEESGDTPKKRNFKKRRPHHGKKPNTNNSSNNQAKKD